MTTSGTTSVAALLGPTNTGKTHRAVQRMLEHGTGMIGLPLRLLAREVYDRITANIGELEVALVTGEEKRIPPRPRYWVCTVEAMPLDRPVDFLAVDEIQLAAHPQRGHVFTDRLLHARGERETWFLGADTMREALEELVPVAVVRRHPRFSNLRMAGAVHLASMPPRSALIAFSAAEVYQLADRLRGRRGGAAVVLGALSPRTRNAQVAMYQAGEVDYLVATDAIGMGLNMDLDHVAFTSLSKFDGRTSRGLSPQEIGQIAGRAGRHVRDGTFGTLAPLELGADVAFAVENHRFAPVRRVVWRNSTLEFSSMGALMASLDERPKRRMLELVERAEDRTALTALSLRPEVMDRATNAAAVRLLWEICEIPDFRKLLPEHHAALLAEIFVALTDGGGVLPHEFMERHVRRLESAEGDIDTLVMRMSLVRTWRYVAQRGSWLRDPAEWQSRTERAEDAISEALHQRLIERFVDRQSKRRRAHAPKSRGSDPRAAVQDAELRAAGPFAALAALRSSVRGGHVDTPEAEGAWVDAIVDAPFHAFVVDESGAILFEGERIAQLVRGVDLVHPEVKLVLARALPQGRQAMLLRRVRALARDVVHSVLGPLEVDAPGSPFCDASPQVRGFAYQLGQTLGTLPIAQARAAFAPLSASDRALVEAAGIRLGRRSAFVEARLDAVDVRRRVALTSAFLERRPAVDVDRGALAVRRAPKVDDATYLCAGYLPFGPLAIRADAVESLLTELDALATTGPFRCPPELAQALGCPVDDVASSIVALGFTETESGFVAPLPPQARRSARGVRPG